MSGPSTPFKLPLKEGVKIALRPPGSMPPDFKGDPNDLALEAQASAIADVVELYVTARLEALALQLKLPSAFIGAGATGPVTIAAASFAAYDPKVT